MTSTSNRAIDFIEDWRNFHKVFGQEAKNKGIEENVKFTPRYIFWTCSDCEADYVERECYGNGKYCAIDNNDAITGREIIEEDLR